MDTRQKGSLEIELCAEAAERAAWRDVFAQAPSALREAWGLEVVGLGGTLSLRAPGVDHLLFNRAFGLHRGTPSTILRRVIEGFRDAGVPRFLLHADEQYGAEATPLLRRYGVAPYRRSWLTLHRDGANPPPEESEFAIAPARTQQTEDAARILGEGFAMPSAAERLLVTLAGQRRWHLHVATSGLRVVAAGLLFVHRDVGYLALAATDPGFRGRGAQRALIASRIRAGLTAGCKRFVTETGEALPSEPNPSEANLRRLGFESLYTRRNYAPTGTTWSRR